MVKAVQELAHRNEKLEEYVGGLADRNACLHEADSSFRQRQAILEEHVGGQQKMIEAQQKQIEELKTMVKSLAGNNQKAGNKSPGELK